MSFTIKLQQYTGDKRRLTKNKEDILELEGTLKDNCSLTDPVILINATNSELKGVNYMTIPTFDRHYFVNEIVNIRTGLFEIHAHVDVLSSFADEIRQNEGIVFRSQNNYNLYINDGSLKTYQNNAKPQTKLFPSGFQGLYYTLIVAGG